MEAPRQIPYTGTWYHVEDRLPENSMVDVLFCDPERIPGIHKGCYYKHKKQWCDSYGNLYKLVSYWTPLPAIPRKENQENKPTQLEFPSVSSDENHIDY